MAKSSYLTFDPAALSDEVKPDVVTPHIPWAKPYVGGTVKALFIGPRFGQRETVEVMQRLSVEADTLLVGLVNQWDWGYPTFVKGSSKAELIEALDKKLDKPYDVIVVGNMDWGLLPGSAVLKIFGQVSKGAGLVICQYGDKGLPSEYRQLLAPTQPAPGFPSLVPLRRFETLNGADGSPIFDAAPMAQCFDFRKGRVCLIDYPGVSNQGIHFLTADPDDALGYEYSQAFLIKALLWASGKSAESFKITDIHAPEVIQRDRVSNRDHLTINVQGAASLSRALVVRDRFGKIWHESTEPPTKVGASLELPLPVLPAETYFADVVFRDGKNVVDWASTSFRVISPEQILDVVLYNDTIYPDEKVKCRVITSRVLKEGESLRVTLTDRWGREFANLKLPDDQFADVLPVRSPMYLAFEWPVADSLSVVNHVRAEWLVGGRVASFMEREFYVPRRKDGDFSTGVWSVTERIARWGWLATQLFSHEHSLGIDAALIGHVYANPVKGIANGLSLARCGLSPFPYIDRNSYTGTSRERTPCLSDPAYLLKRGKELRSWAWEFRKSGCIGYNMGDEANLSILGVDVCTAAPTLKAFREWLAKQYGTIAALNAEYGTTWKSWDDVFPPTRKEAETQGNLAPWLDHKVFMAQSFADYLGAMQDQMRISDPLARAGFEGIWGSAPAHGFEWTSQAEKAGVMIPYSGEALAIEAVRSFAKPSTLTGLWSGGYPHIAMYEWKSRHVPWYGLLHGMNSAWFYADYDGTTVSLPQCMISQDFTLNRAGQWFKAEIDIIKGGIGKLILNSKRRNDPIALLYSQVSGYIAGNHADDWIAAIEDAGYQYDVIARRDLEREGALANYKVLALPYSVSLSDAEVKEIRRFIAAGGKVLTDTSPGEYDGRGRKREQSPLKDLPVLEFNLERYEAARAEGKRQEVPAKIGALLEKAGLPKRESAQGLERIAYDIPGGTILAYHLRGTETVQVRALAGAFDLIEGKPTGSEVAVKPGRPLLLAMLARKPGPLVAKVEKKGHRFTIATTQEATPFNVIHVAVSDPVGKRMKAYDDNLILRDGRVEFTLYLGENAAPSAWTVVLRDALAGQAANVKLEVTTP